MSLLPDYLERRIRRPIPADSHVVAGSTPVVSFGNARTATVATLGLNPSGASERLQVPSERCVARRRQEPTSSRPLRSRNSIRLIVGCATGDQDRLELVKPLAVRIPLEVTVAVLQHRRDDLHGSACHLDLVQWATDPTWGRLQPTKLRKQLLDADGPFLIEQLSNETINVLLVNGMGVVRQLLRLTGAIFEECEPIVGLAFQRTRLFAGVLLGRVHVVAWSTNLQSSFGVTSELRSALADRVATLVRQSQAA